MIRILIVLFTIFCAILWTGMALRCLQCKESGEDCTGSPTDCKYTNDVCTEAIEHNNVDGDKRPTVLRGCMNSTSKCNKIFTINTGSFQLNSFFNCCATDNCNSGPIKMPPLNTTKNGLSCSSCVVEGTYECEEYGSVDCTGDQGNCIQFSGDATRPGGVENKYAFAGCTSQKVCDTGYDMLIGSLVGNVESLSCIAET
ncbi:phospholipase A2 inhibitor and Ly6/PLAUR domain-containing protein-like [Phyllobates terribilis]|uniref:phospholipase A2 inhibitor and Ly6/PLAUR domain-containing protein-like n=1 Tax=Phyllobates terribilis TaxID=111132 RepID=UPI003CCA994C